MRLALMLLLTSALPAAAGECTDAYNRGFAEGVDAVNARLGAVTAQIQKDVQAQVNAQLVQLEARRTQELEARLARAQGEAVAQQGPSRVEGPERKVTMPRLPALVRAPGGGIAPMLPRDQAAATAIRLRPDPQTPADPASLPAGTTITITDPQNLPPELFRALMDYAVRSP